MSEQVSILAAIEEADITPFGLLKGKSNDKPLEIAGVKYGVGEVRFDGFAGGLDVEGQHYCGFLRWTPVQPGQFDVADLSGVKGIDQRVKNVAKPTAAKGGDE